MWNIAETVDVHVQPQNMGCARLGPVLAKSTSSVDTALFLLLHAYLPVDIGGSMTTSSSVPNIHTGRWQTCLKPLSGQLHLSPDRYMRSFP